VRGRGHGEDLDGRGVGVAGAGVGGALDAVGVVAAAPDDPGVAALAALVEAFEDFLAGFPDGALVPVRGKNPPGR
jgi:hypothetical protein